MVTFPNPAPPHRRPLATLAFQLEPATLAAPDAAGVVASLLQALDTLEHRFVFLDRGGEFRHASRAFRGMAADPALTAVEGEVRRFAACLWGAANVRGLEHGIEPLDVRPVPVAGGDCRLQGTFVGVDLFGSGPSVLVDVRLSAAPPATPEQLRERFGLTRKQSRVAGLLVEGLRNDEIARRLFISPHTARHHVEQVMMKVGGHTRTAVASRLREVEP